MIHTCATKWNPLSNDTNFLHHLPGQARPVWLSPTISLPPPPSFSLSLSLSLSLDFCVMDRSQALMARSVTILAERNLSPSLVLPPSPLPSTQIEFRDRRESRWGNTILVRSSLICCIIICNLFFIHWYR